MVDVKGFIAGYWGEVLTVYAQTAGIAGLVIDGGVRDTAALAQCQFPAFSRGISVKGTIKASVLSVGHPIILAGTPVSLGDLVEADGDGGVVIPADHAEAVVQRADIISLCAGEPDFDTPEHIADAGVQAIRSGKTVIPPLQACARCAKPLPPSFSVKIIPT